MALASTEKQIFICESCGYSSVKWLGRCPECGSWDSMEERRVQKPVIQRTSGADAHQTEAPLPLSEISSKDKAVRLETGIAEVDRVLGGGIVAGSLILLGGEPGIGKSTLLLQTLSVLSGRELKVLYVSGEESSAQIKLRAERIGPGSGSMLVLCESAMPRVEEAVRQTQPDILAVDSIQTLHDPGIGSLPGSINQVRSVASALMQVAKGMGLTVFIIGHVTKEGAIAGPRALEHLVDTVLYFEGDRTHSFRILRTVKNRFGPTHEIGVFEMTDSGLKEVTNPSNVFMDQREKDIAGSVIVPCLEGTRPILVEIQALVNRSYLAMPRRTTAGVDSNRLALLTAVAEKHLGIALYDRDIFINVAGGFRLSEPAADLPLICAILSSFTEKALGLGTAVFGEVGLTGEIRPVGRMQLRINEASRLGINKCLVPRAGTEKLKVPEGMELVRASSLQDINSVLQP